MIAEPHNVECGPPGNRQHGLRVVRMQRRHVARKLRIARQSDIVGELHRDMVAVPHNAIRHARRRIEHDAPEVGMIARTDRYCHRIISQSGEDQ